MMVLISAGSLLTIYLGLALMLLPSYALVAFNRESVFGSEAALKFFVLSALASGILLFGMSLVFGASGSLDRSEERRVGKEWRSRGEAEHEKRKTSTQRDR